MKVMLLAAGLGTRLRPLTARLPKCMLQVAGKPVLQRNIEWLRSQGAIDLVVNLHHYPEVVTGYFGDGSGLGVRLHYSFEPELLGTAGAVWAAREHFRSGPFLVVYADNLIDFNLNNLFARHACGAGTLTMALFWREDVSASGVVAMDADGRITAFKEKPRPQEILSNWVNAGLFICEPAVLEHIPSDRPSDFGYEVLPAMLAARMPMYGYTMGPKETLIWIDTKEDLSRAAALLGEKP